MSMQDPISDMLTRIRNALAVGKEAVVVLMSRVNREIAQVLKNEGYILDCQVEKNSAGHSELIIHLKYYEGLPAIARLQRVSTRGVPRYRKKSELPTVKNGLGIAIISTSKGLMTDRQARLQGHGGEVICEVE